MNEASRAFSVSSRGAYTGLRTQLGTVGDTLVALSKRKVFQLYLALRAAGYRQFVAQHGPVPFVTDEIMETFDTGRMEETPRVLGDMATLGHLMDLTHHEYLTEIARQTVPDVRVLQL